MPDNHQPATKQDLKELRSELRVDLASKQDLELLRTDVLAGLERVETNLLTAFHSWARTYEVRARGTSTLVAGFEERLALAEERLNRLERGERTH